MEYNKNDEKVLNSFKINDFNNKPEWGGTIVEIYQYQSQKPKVRLTRWYTPKGSNETKISNFVSISGIDGLKTLGGALIKIAESMEEKNKQNQAATFDEN